MFDEDELLPLSGLQHVVYCARRFALVHVERQWVENSATVDGRNVHARVHEAPGEVRGETRIARGLWLRSLRLGLSGVADVVEFHRIGDAASDVGVILAGVAGRWCAFPVEYKRGILRHESAYAVQLCAQAIALEEMLCTSVLSGALYYGQSHRREDVRFDAELRLTTEAAARHAHEIARSGSTPPPIPGPKCGPCSMRNLCLPDCTDNSMGASAFLARTIREVAREVS